MKQLILGAVIALVSGPVLAGGPVVVADDPVVVAAPAPDPGFDWTGFYAGASLGKGRASGTTAEDTSFYGLQAGYLRDFGNLVVGGELTYTKGDLDDFPGAEYDSTRLKLIGGYGAGRFMPYVTIGVTDFTLSSGTASLSDNGTIYGIGGRYALGATGRHVVGLEYTVETFDNFADTGIEVDNKEVSLRYDFRF